MNLPSEEETAHQRYACAGESLLDTLKRLHGAAEKHMAERDAANARAEALKGALKELVACKDLKERAQTMNYWPANADKIRERAQTEAEYHRRQPLAWSAARALIQEGK